MNEIRPRSSNPALRTIARRGLPQAAAGEAAMTVGGTVNRTIVMIALVVIAAAWVWSRYALALPDTEAAAKAVSGYLIAGVIGGLVLAIATVFKPTWARVTAPAYALLEGCFIGGISALLNNRYPGIVLEAVGLTFAVMIGMLLLYKTRIIKVTPALQRGIIIATFGVLLFYGVSWLLTLFHVDTSMLFGNTKLSIIISLVIVGIAAFNLVLDFHFIDQGAAAGLPRYMEWYGAFALTVTLVWLYLEILRLLAATRR
ncbi:MAG TPA: Bax inhibitor-1/YccA family protein [Gammaproteobacteria bacterium]|nr:Bax inhibitor-1/YccA family protein [Gammaproteobacteria bacterium]